MEVINIYYERLKEKREEKNLSLFQLSEMTGIPKSTLQRYEKGTTKKIPIEAVSLIEKALNLSTGYLMGWETDNISNIPNLLPPNITKDVITFPVIGEIAAGYEKEAFEDWSGETVEIPLTYIKGRNKDDFFVLKVVGDSMYPLYQEGDKVLVLKQSTLNYSGSIGAVMYDDNLATLKKVEYAPGEDWMRLVPINPAHTPKRIEGSDLEKCRILGIPKLLIREISE